MENGNMNLAKEILGTIKTLKDKMPAVCGIVAINNYENAYGEITNRRINVGLKLAKAKAKSVEMLKAFDVTNIDAEKMNKAIKKALFNRVKKEISTDAVSLTKAVAKMVEQLEKPSKKMSDAQINAYTVLSNGIKVHNETGDLYIYGVQVGKKEVKVIAENEKLTNSGEITVLKKAIEYYLNLPHSKFKMFKIDGGNLGATQGKVIEFLPTDGTQAKEMELA